MDQGLDRRILELRRSMLPHAIERVLLRAQVLYGDRVEGRIEVRLLVSVQEAAAICLMESATCDSLEAIHALVGLSAHAAEQKRQALEIVTRCLKDSDSSVRRDEKQKQHGTLPLVGWKMCKRGDVFEQGLGAP
eukprot:2240527-Amphidinium_carterae.1